MASIIESVRGYFKDAAPQPVPARSEETIRAELGDAQAEYNEAVRTKPQHEVLPLSRRITELRKELSGVLSEGANPCPDCGNPPIGLRHVHVVAATNRRVFTFEVGCVSCKDHRAQGSSIAESVAEWNAGKYLPPKA